MKIEKTIYLIKKAGAAYEYAGVKEAHLSR